MDEPVNSGSTTEVNRQQPAGGGAGGQEGRALQLDRDFVTRKLDNDPDFGSEPVLKEGAGNSPGPPEQTRQTWRQDWWRRTTWNSGSAGLRSPAPRFVGVTPSPGLLAIQTDGGQFLQSVGVTGRS